MSKDVVAYIAAFTEPEAFKALDQQAGFDAALIDVKRSANLLKALVSSKEWRLVYSDLLRAVFIKESSGIISDWPQWSPSYYEGENLRDQYMLYPTYFWTDALSEAGKTESILILLKQLQSASEIPDSTLAWTTLKRNRCSKACSS